jgi:hypothetical protein
MIAMEPDPTKREQAMMNAMFIINARGNNTILNAEIREQLGKTEWDNYDVLIDKWTTVMTSLESTGEIFNMGQVQAHKAVANWDEILCHRCGKKGHTKSKCTSPITECEKCGRDHLTSLHDDIISKL